MMTTSSQEASSAKRTENCSPCLSYDFHLALDLQRIEVTANDVAAFFAETMSVKP
jgi:hypothetical protein